MKHGFTVGLLGASVLLLTTGGIASAQSPVVSQPSTSALSPALSDLPTAHWAQSPQGLKLTPPPKPLRPRGAGPGGANAGDAALQRQPGPASGVQPKANFGGIGANGYIPPDPNIAVGKNDSSGFGYIVQLVNSEMAVFNKSGNLLMGPVSLSSVWSGLPGGGGCATNNAGDPVVQYDVAADRWLVSQLGSTSGPTYSECIAVSQTNDPRGLYFLYSYNKFFGNNLNDYPKFGVWPTLHNSAYLASYNLFAGGQNFVGAGLCAYDRSKMLTGDGTAAEICFTVANDGGFLPADLDGATPPPDGTPGYFLNFETLSTLRLYQAQLDFANPAAATLQATPDISVASFGEACYVNGGSGTCVAQPNSQKLDSLGDRLMYRLAYRVFGDHAALVVNHSVTAGSSVGVRWYELRQSALASSPCESSFISGAFYLCQQGTFAPDSAYRWMGSAAMDGAGNIAVGYSKSSGNSYPSIAFTSRTPGMSTGTMSAEKVLQAGGGAQTNFSRWGDYTSLRIDPTDDTTFWYTNEYYSHGGIFNYMWSTAIGSFTVAASGGGTTPDFGLSVASNSLSVTRGSSKSTTVSTTAVNGSSSVTLSASGLLKGISANFSPNPLTTPGNSTLTITAGHQAAAGTSNITISGNNGSATHTTTLVLTVQ